MGFSGNMEPSFVIPTVVALSSAASSASGHSTSSPERWRDVVAADLDFCIGNEALSAAAASPGQHFLACPVQRGQIVDLDSMERFWLRSFYEYLSVDPEEHFVLLSESPLTSPEQREAVAEVMFETFNVRGLHIAPQPVLSFTAANAAAQTPRTGVVLDVGEHSVSVASLVEGFMLPGSIRSSPIGGAHLTSLVLEVLKERGQALEASDALATAQKVKEAYGYVCSDIVKEFGKHEKEPAKYQKLWTGKSKSAGEEVSCLVGPERFLAAEALFNADLMGLLQRGQQDAAALRQAAQLGLSMGLGSGASAGLPGEGQKEASGQGRASSLLGQESALLALPLLVDSSIQSAPIDSKRALYKTVVLSGGSTLFKDFGKRLQRDLKRIVEARQAAAGKPKDAVDIPSASSQRQSRAYATTGAVDVAVVSHPVQDLAAWFGGSIVASMQTFPELCHTREQYAEFGPGLCRAHRTTTMQVALQH